MTSMPALYWAIWILGLDYLGGMCLWVKSTRAISREPLNSAAEDPIARHYGMQICKIGAVCPHCGETVFLQEMVAHGAAGQAYSMSRAKLGIIGWLWSFRKQRWFFYCCYLAALVASLAFQLAGKDRRIEEEAMRKLCDEGGRGHQLRQANARQVIEASDLVGKVVR